MPQSLVAAEFTPAQLNDVADFDCGDEPWEYAISEWIKGHRAVESIARGTHVWLYYDQDRKLVGYGSLGKTRRKWPPPDGDWINLSIIPSLGVMKSFQGEPKDDPPKFSAQIMGDLIARTRLHGTELLILDVHKENLRAIRFYEKFDFFAEDYEKDDYVRMYHRLAAQS